MYVPDWTPCIADPDDFDCAECELADESCRLRVDDGLRHYIVAQRRRWRGVAVSVDLDGDHDLRAAIEILRVQRLALPAGLLARLIGAVEPRAALDLVAALRSSPAVHEKSPGMFALGPDMGLGEVSHTRADLHSGAQLEASIHASPMLERGEQRRLLKRYRGLVVAGDSLSRRGRDQLEAVIESLHDLVGAVRGWTDRDIALYAINDGPVPMMPDEAIADATSRLLAAVHGLQLLQSGHVSADAEAVRRALTVANLRLVAKIALIYAGRGSMLFMDLFDHGVFGLMRAIKRFDPYRGFELSTYATWWIRQQITRAIADEGSLIRVPVHAYEAVTQSRSHDHASAALASTDSSVVVAAKEALRPYLPMEAAASIQDLSVEIEIDLLELRTVLLPLLDVLSPEQRTVIAARTGLDGGPNETLQVVGDRLGVTRERVRQIEERGLRKLRSRARRLRVIPSDLGVVRGRFSAAGEEPGVSGDPSEKVLIIEGSVKHPRRVERELRDERLEEGKSPDQAEAAEWRASTLEAVQNQVSDALVAADVRVAAIGGWTVELGFLPAPSKLSAEARAAVEGARRRVVRSAGETRPPN